MPTVKIEVRGGGIEGEVQGMSGPGCKDLIRPLLERLNLKDLKEEERAEYYEVCETRTQDLGQSQGGVTGG